MSPVAVDDRSTGAATGAPARRHRPELQGLRALAVALVVVYHVWLGRVSGGVDVFFVISGFLVTAQLVRAATGPGIRFGAHWARTLKRLVPSSVVVLLSVLVAAVALLPENRWLQTAREIGASALFAQNWQLAYDAVDYYAQNNTASVVQHFWSLAIQGQFHLVWPLLVALVVLVARDRPLRALFVVLAVVSAASLAFSALLTAADQPFAYFHSLTRVWEFGAGGLLALLVDRVDLDRRLRVLLGWAGVVALVSCGVAMDVGSRFPGYLALWPVLAACAVVVAGSTGSPHGVDRWLSARPVTYLGDLSFALYLWHWPVLVFYLVVRDRTVVGPLGGGFVIALSLLLAAATHHLVEEPLRRARSSTRRSYALVAAGVVAVLGAATAWNAVVVRDAERFSTLVGDRDHPGAIARVPGFEYTGAEDAVLIPSQAVVAKDWPDASAFDCAVKPGTEQLQVCESTWTDTPARTLTIVGDSHMYLWSAGLVEVAKRRNWALDMMVLGGCPYSTRSETYPGDDRCREWTDQVTGELLDRQPDAVVTLATRNARPGRTETTPDGFVERWRQLDDAGITVLAFRDNPRYDSSPSACVALRGRDADACTAARGDIYAETPPYADRADISPNVFFFDFADYYCDALTCPPVIGNVLVHLDDNHLTATFMESMAPIAEEAVLTATDWE
ncbi:acyltransferase family protein [Actinokineospora bangkokensis]|uniref:Acyltransferase n=1 Tax=Actinokineospora bangkokensis TaxID=1193682 RepID=A0A1Q9LJ18_9PSEU|nr:acyltransferase family protein [Actinokineospora bangkokensis]OLR92003.1 acyltransferase [Actinokineospora bangkokensis]